MTKRDELASGDVQLHPLAKELASARGKEEATLAERLNQDEGFDYPAALDALCNELIQEHYEAAEKARARTRRTKGLRRVAAVLLVVGVFFALPFASVSAFRASVMNFVVDFFDEGARLTVSGGDDEQYGGSLQTIGEPTWLPEGFELTEQVGYHGKVYTNADGAVINYWESPIDTSAVIDTEDADVAEATIIRDYNALIVVKENRVHLVWIDTDRNIVCSLVCHGLDEEAARRIAESVEE